MIATLATACIVNYIARLGFGCNAARLHIVPQSRNGFIKRQNGVRVDLVIIYFMTVRFASCGNGLFLVVGAARNRQNVPLLAAAPVNRARPHSNALLGVRGLGDVPRSPDVSLRRSSKVELDHLALDFRNEMLTALTLAGRIVLSPRIRN